MTFVSIRKPLGVRESVHCGCDEEDKADDDNDDDDDEDGNTHDDELVAVADDVKRR